MSLSNQFDYKKNVLSAQNNSQLQHSNKDFKNIKEKNIIR